MRSRAKATGHRVDVGRDVPPRLAELRPDVGFNALHGRYGEDGCVQGMLEILGIPYTHSGVLASALAMNKERAKRVLRGAGVPVAESMVVSRAEAAQRHAMKPPYVVKPAPRARASASTSCARTRRTRRQELNPPTGPSAKRSWSSATSPAGS